MRLWSEGRVGRHAGARVSGRAVHLPELWRRQLGRSHPGGPPIIWNSPCRTSAPLSRRKPASTRAPGPGISETDRAQLFTPFFTTKRDGRGIGLTVVQEILANHGFAFSLENRSEGGAEFTIRLRD